MGGLTPLLRPYPTTLWERGQVKPTGPWRINWAHPLTVGLIQYFIDSGNGYVVDLVTGRVATKPAAMTAPLTDASPYGAGNKYNVNNAQVSDPVAASNQNLTAPYSIASAILTLGAGGVNAGYFSLADSGGNDCVAIFNPSTTTFGVSFNNSASANNFTFTNNTFYVIVGSQTAAAANTWWVNGVAQTAGTSTAFSGSAQHYNFGGGASFGTASNLNPNAFVFFGAVWQGRALAQADAALLTTDPYCFLVPLQPEMMAFQLPVADVLQSQIWV